MWLDDQEQLAGFVSPETLRGQFRTAYDQLSQGHAWVLIPRLRQQLQWPQERFDTVLEAQNERTCHERQTDDFAI